MRCGSLGLAMVLALGILAPVSAQEVDCPEQQAVADDAGYGSTAQQTLFYNFYTQPGAGAVGAQLYPSPRPTPPWVGGTYITYQPFMPHEYLYTHHRSYAQTHANGTRTRTRVRWGHVCWNQVWRPSPKPQQKNRVDLTNQAPGDASFWRVNPAWWNAGYHQ